MFQILVERRHNILKLYERHTVKNGLKNEIQAVVNELPYEIEEVYPAVVMSICNRLGLVNPSHVICRTIEKKTHRKVKQLLRIIIKNKTATGLETNQVKFNKQYIEQTALGDEMLSSFRLLPKSNDKSVVLSDVSSINVDMSVRSDDSTVLLESTIDELSVNNGFVTPTKCMTSKIMQNDDGNIISDNIFTKNDSLSNADLIIEELNFDYLKDASCNTNYVEQNCLGEEFSSSFRLIPRDEDVLEVVLNGTPSNTNSSLLKLCNNDVFVTPVKRDTIKRNILRSPQNANSVSLFEINNEIDLFRKTGKTREIFVSPVKSPLKRLNEKNFNKIPGEILPRHSQNIYPKHIEGKSYVFIEGQFKVPGEEWHYIYENGKLNQKRYLNYTYLVLLI